VIFCHSTHLWGADCDAVASHRYTWPGQHEAAACEVHFRDVHSVALDLGLDIVATALTLADHANPVHPLTNFHRAPALDKADLPHRPNPVIRGDVRRTIAEAYAALNRIELTAAGVAAWPLLLGTAKGKLAWLLADVFNETPGGAHGGHVAQVLAPWPLELELEREVFGGVRRIDRASTVLASEKEET
jgi:hypothetical protein